MLGLGAPPLLPLVAMRVFGDSHAGADADDLQHQRRLACVTVHSLVQDGQRAAQHSNANM